MKVPLLAHCSSLELLKRIPRDSVKLVYIDPPWAGASDTSLAELYLHTAAFCKACLKSDGVIVWHAVPRVVAIARLALDQVFGRNLFESEFILQSSRRGPRMLMGAPGHSNLIVYSKSGIYRYNPPVRVAPTRSDRLDDSGRAYWCDSLTFSGKRVAMAFDWRGYRLPEGQSWRYTAERLERLAEENRIIFPRLGLPKLKRFEDERPAAPMGSVWSDLTLEKAELVEANHHPDQQPIALAERIIEAFTEDGDRVVDPYCGSGSFVVAANALNREWLGADLAENSIQTTEGRIRSHSVDFDGFVDCSKLDSFPVEHRLVDLLREFSIDYAAKEVDTAVLLTRDESKMLEFKQTLSWDLRVEAKSKHIELAAMKTIAAFLNSKGGTLVIGVADNKAVPGIRSEVEYLYQGSVDKFLLHFKNLLSHQIGAEYYDLVDQRVVRFDDVAILRVDVQSSLNPCYIGDDFYVRTNPATDRITGKKLFDYIGQRFFKRTET